MIAAAFSVVSWDMDMDIDIGSALGYELVYYERTYMM